MMPIFRGKGFAYIVLTAFVLVVFGTTYWIISNLMTEVVIVEEIGTSEAAPVVCNEELLAKRDTNVIPFTCTFTIHENKKGTLLITESNIQVRDGNVVIFDSLDTAYAFPETLETRNSWGGDGNFVLGDLVRIHDLTYDGYADLMIQSNSGASNLVYDVIAYDASTGSYAKTKLLEGLFNPRIDTTTQSIWTSAFSGRGDGVSEFLQYNGSEYMPRKRLEQTTVDDVLMRIYFEWKGGEWIETAREVADGYPPQVF